MMEAWQATVQDEAGNVVFNPQVTVYQEDGSTLASIFNEDGSPKSNPFTGTTEGFVQFWAGPGTYKVVGGSGGGVTETWSVKIGGDVQSYSSIQDLALNSSKGVFRNGQTVSLGQYVPNSFTGGGLLVWRSGLARSNHDGGRFFSPTVPWSNLPDYLSGFGESAPSANGVFERVGISAMGRDVSFWGANLTVNTNSANAAAISAAASSSVPGDVIFPAGSWNIQNVDFQNSNITSASRSSFTGSWSNPGRLTGISIDGFTSSDPSKPIQMPAKSDSGVMVVKVEDNGTDTVCYAVHSINRATGEFTRIDMRKSPGSDLPPWELIREQRVFSVFYCAAFQRIDTASSRFISADGFSNVTFGSDNFAGITAPELDTSRSNYPQALDSAGSPSGSYVEFNLDAPDGNATLSFSGLTQNGTVNIIVDGVSQYASYRVNAGASGARRIITIPVRVRPSGSVVRVEKIGVTNVRILGANIYRPGDGRGLDDFTSGLEANIVYDGFISLVRNADAAYVSNSGAAEYAIRAAERSDSTRGFVGSAHGSESQFSPGNERFMLNGVVGSNERFSLGIGAPRCGLGFTMEQRTVISERIDARHSYRFGDSYIDKDINLSGVIRGDIQYLGMALPRMNFSRILFPIGGSTGSDDVEIPLGNCEGVILKDPLSRKTVYCYHTPHLGMSNNRGGNFIKVLPPQYNKFYTSYGNGYDFDFGDVSFQMTHMYL